MDLEQPIFRGVYRCKGTAHERQSSIIVLLLKEVDSWPEMTASKLHSHLHRDLLSPPPHESGSEVG